MPGTIPNSVTLKVSPATRKAVKRIANESDKGITETADKIISLGISRLSDQENPETKLQHLPDCILKNKEVDKKHAGDILDGIEFVVPQEIAPWIPKLIKVLSGPARRALEANLDTFVEYTSLKEGVNEPPPGEAAEDALQRSVEGANSIADDIKNRLAQRDRSAGKRGKTA